MVKEYSLHIGINQVSERHYRGLVPELYGCWNDAVAMYEIAQKLNYYHPATLGDECATFANVANDIIFISKLVKPGDIFLLTYSGHGTQIIDEDGDESDRLDECLILYNKIMTDDYLTGLFRKFPEDTRIVVIADCCHSATICEHCEDIKASGILISSCHDHQLSIDTEKHGLFTQALLDVWDDGKFEGNYLDFRNEIAKKVPKSQTPNYLTFGKENPEFWNSKPFTQ
jgi:hypothetical protein